MYVSYIVSHLFHILCFTEQKNAVPPRLVLCARGRPGGLVKVLCGSLVRVLCGGLGAKSCAGLARGSYAEVVCSCPNAPSRPGKKSLVRPEVLCKSCAGSYAAGQWLIDPLARIFDGSVQQWLSQTWLFKRKLVLNN